MHASPSAHNQSFVGLLNRQRHILTCNSSECWARGSMPCRAKGEARLHSHQSASHLCGQPSGSGEAAPGQRRGDFSHLLTAILICIIYRFTLDSCLPVLTRVTGNV